MLAGLTILGDASLELTDTSSNNQDGAIGLGGTRDHVLDEITVTGSVDDGDAVLERRQSKALVWMQLIVTLLVSNFHRAISMVIPRSRSALSLSKTQAYLKEPV